jgi:asparagine synthase (glutamine-hydrolysing)
MCGFSGIFSPNAQGNLGATMERMTATLVSRGPDASGIFVSNRIALGHRRLSILDLSETGAQPMRLERSGITIAYNGEVYNFGELRSELMLLGHHFVGRSDTEVILHTYEAWGLEGLKRLEGLFGFALWDEPRQRLVLMRDRLGIKPVYYGESSVGFAFGSEIKAVLAAGGVDSSIDNQALREYLWYGNSFGDRTFYQGVRSLEPGHWLIFEGGRRRLQAWWSIEEWLQKEPVSYGFEDAIDRIRSAIDSAVARQLVADVPVGIFLSGGVDSSAIAASAVHSRKMPLQSYAAGFDFDRGVNELPKAAFVARQLGLDHRELKIGGADLPEVLLHLAAVHDEPFADAANIPLYLMCKALDGRVKVVLQGDGGDELFGGYRRYSVLRNAWLWNRIPGVACSIARQLGSFGRRFARMAESVKHVDSAMRMGLLLTTEMPGNPPEALFSEPKRRDLQEGTDPFLVYRNAAERFAEHEPVQQMLLTDLTVQLPSQFLTKVDRATMAAGVEARVPLLDERVAELAVGFPSEWKVHGAKKKIVLRESQRGRLPDSVLDGPKAGFGVPYEYWLRSSLFEFSKERLLDNGFLRRFSLDPRMVESALSEHRSGSRDRGFLLWKLLNLQLWGSVRPTDGVAAKL